jgi:hypothetical protein
MATWVGGEPSQPFHHYVMLPSVGLATESHAPSTDLWWKLACHFMIDRMPYVALREAAESLHEIAQFHHDRIPAELPRIPSSTVRGRIVSTEIQPPFELSEE